MVRLKLRCLTRGMRIENVFFCCGFPSGRQHPWLLLAFEYAPIGTRTDSFAAFVFTFALTFAFAPMEAPQ